MPTLATCQLKEFQGSGIKGSLNLSQSDDGSTLTVKGSASGFGLLGRVFVSLAYGLGSNAQVDPFNPQKPPCADDRSFDVEPPPVGGNDPGSVIFSPVATARMLLGVWGGVLGVPVLGDTRKLDVTKPTSSPSASASTRSGRSRSGKPPSRTSPTSISSRMSARSCSGSGHAD